MASTKVLDRRLKRGELAYISAVLDIVQFDIPILPWHVELSFELFPFSHVQFGILTVGYPS